MKRPKVAKGAWILKMSAPGWWFGGKMIEGLATGLAAQVELGMAETVALRTVLWELTQNAIVHGNGGSESLPVAVKACWDGSMLQVSVEDKGEGFDHHALKVAPGLAKIRSLLGGQLTYELDGRRAVMWLPVIRHA